MVPGGAFEPLATTKTPRFTRGAVFRCLPEPGAKTGRFDLLLVEQAEAPSGLALLVTTGYKAGLVFQALPREALDAEVEYPAVPTAWLREQWATWIQEHGADGVLVSTGYELPAAEG